MPGNGLTNAGFQDGVTAWSPSAGAVLTANENTYGYEGRTVLQAEKVVANPETVSITSGTVYDVAVTAGQTIEVFGHHVFTRGTSQLTVRYYDAANAMVGAAVEIPIVRFGDGNPRLGLASSFHFSHARRIVPAGATRARLRLLGTSQSAGNAHLLLMKPYLEALPSSKTKYRCWDPGLSINPDLDLPHWPSELPHIRADNFSVEPIPTRKGFQGETGVTLTKKVTTVPWYLARGSVKVNQEGHAILDKFFRTGSEPFWFVRPDTLQLCRATWLPDGEPVYSGLGADKMASFGLQIQVL